MSRVGYEPRTSPYKYSKPFSDAKRSPPSRPRDWPRMLRNGAKLTLRGSYAPTTAQPQLPRIFLPIEEISRSIRCTRLSNYVDAILFHDLPASFLQLQRSILPERLMFSARSFSMWFFTSTKELKIGTNSPISVQRVRYFVKNYFSVTRLKTIFPGTEQNLSSYQIPQESARTSEQHRIRHIDNGFVLFKHVTWKHVLNISFVLAYIALFTILYRC